VCVCVCVTQTGTQLPCGPAGSQECTFSVWRLVAQLVTSCCCCCCCCLRVCNKFKFNAVHAPSPPSQAHAKGKRGAKLIVRVSKNGSQMSEDINLNHCLAQSKIQRRRVAHCALLCLQSFANSRNNGKRSPQASPLSSVSKWRAKKPQEH